MPSLHCKKLEVDLTQKRSSQLQSGFIQIQAVAQLLSPGFRVISLVQWRFLVNRFANEIHFVIACLCQKGVELSLYSCIIGLTLKNMHC